LIQLLILPGLGGDHRMTHTQLALPYTLITPDYIPFEHGESLVAYAKRFCDYLLSTHAVDLDRPLFVAGYSMGAAIGMEIAEDLPVRGLILIGGPLSSNEIGLIPRVFGRYVCKWLPLWFFRSAEVLIAPIMRKYSGIEEYEVMLCIAMYRHFGSAMFREAYHSLAWWHGTKLTVPYLRIHGENDHIITCPKPGSIVGDTSKIVGDIPANEIIIPKMKHLVGQSRPKQVNDAIEEFISRIMRNDR
jgi:pimeloyl-ACP methyl ester carboxylesterase